MDEDIVEELRQWWKGPADLLDLLKRAADKIERLREIVTIPIITPDAPPGVYVRVLREHEKGDPVNTQDLINALMWRVANQRREIARLHEKGAHSASTNEEK